MKPVANPVAVVTPKSRRPASIRLISVQAAAEAAGVKVTTIRQWIKAGAIRAEQSPRSQVGLRRGPMMVIAVRYAEFCAFLLRRGIPINPKHKPPTYAAN